MASRRGERSRPVPTARSRAPSPPQDPLASSALVDPLSRHTMQRAPPNGLPHQSVRYPHAASGNFNSPNDGGNLNRAGTVRATIRHDDLLPGQVPGNAQVLGWWWVGQITGQNRSGWVRFHLWNEQLGGRNESTNLVPTTQGDNTTPAWRGFEEAAKDELWGRGTVAKPVHIEVSATFHAGGPQATPPAGNAHLYAFPDHIQGRYWTWNAVNQSWVLGAEQPDFDIDEPALDANNVEHYLTKTSENKLENDFQVNHWLAMRLPELRERLKAASPTITDEQSFYNWARRELFFSPGEYGDFLGGQSSFDRLWPTLQTMLQDTVSGHKLRPFKGWAPSGVNAVLYRDRQRSVQQIKAANNNLVTLQDMAQKLNVHISILSAFGALQDVPADLASLYRALTLNLQPRTALDAHWPAMAQAIDEGRQLYFIPEVRGATVVTWTEREQRRAQMVTDLRLVRDQGLNQLVPQLQLGFTTFADQKIQEADEAVRKQTWSTFDETEARDKARREIDGELRGLVDRSQKVNNMTQEIGQLQGLNQLHGRGAALFQTKSQEAVDSTVNGRYVFETPQRLHDEALGRQTLDGLVQQALALHLQGVPQGTLAEQAAVQRMTQTLSETPWTTFFFLGNGTAQEWAQREMQGFPQTLAQAERRAARAVVEEEVVAGVTARILVLKDSREYEDITARRYLRDEFLPKATRKIRESANLTTVAQVTQYINHYLQTELPQAERHGRANKRRK